MVRPVTDDDIGLLVLREGPLEAAPNIDIVAVHGIGAHPDDSWCKNVGTTENPRWVSWLTEENMLPAVAKDARIMRYGYQSQWFGEGATKQNASTVAQRLLLALRRKRKEYPFRPLLFIAHCFGGLVVLKALLEAQYHEKDWPGIFASTTGIIFFGTPFRGAEGMSQMEMLEAARREYDVDESQTEVLKVLEQGNEFLQDLVDQFGKTRKQPNKAHVACFYELKASDVGRIVGGQKRVKFVVSESSGCLDLSESTNKFSLSRTHFDMNKFGKPTEEDFETVSEVIGDMITASHELMAARSQSNNGKHKIDFSLRGVPVINKFVPRTSYMEKIENALLGTDTRRKVAILYGLGGIGKTQLAVEFAREHHGKFSSVLWLNGSSKTALEQSFVNILPKLDDLTADGAEALKDPKVDAALALRECLRWLSLLSNNRWLLIFDNVDRDFHNKEDLEAYKLENYLPTADHGSILITSRLAGLQDHGLGIKVATVTSDEGRAILENNAGRTLENPEMILERLRGLPLALTQAGSYIRQTSISVPKYVKQYEETWEQLMKSQSQFLSNKNGNLLTTFTMSFEQVQKQSQTAAHILKLWGFLDCEELWYDLLTLEHESMEGNDGMIWLRQATQSELGFHDTMSILLRYSLADATEGTESYSMHSVVHKWCSKLAQCEEKQRYGSLANMVVALNAVTMSDKGSLIERKRLLKNVVLVSRRIGEDFISEESTERGDELGFIQYLRTYLEKIGRAKDAEFMFEKVLQGCKTLFGDEHKATLDVAQSLGHVYLILDRIDKAEETFERVLNGRRKGADRISTLEALTHMAFVFTSTERLNEAEKMYQEALNGYAEELGEDHSDTLGVATDLASLYMRQNRPHDAEKMLSRVAKTFQETLGEGHRDTLFVLQQLAESFEKQGKSNKAEETLVRVAHKWQKTLGKSHGQTLLAFHDLAKFFHDHGKLRLAGTAFCHILHAVWEKLREDNSSPPITVRQLGNTLADTLADIGYSDEAISVADTLHGLGELVYKLGHFHEAEDMFKLALRVRQNILGPENSSTLHTNERLGDLLNDQGRLNDAEEMYTQILRIEVKRLGKECPLSPSSCVSIASIMKKQGRLDEAEAMLKLACQGSHGTFEVGDEMPILIATSLENLYLIQGRLDEAKKCQAFVSDMERKVDNDQEEQSHSSETIPAVLGENISGASEAQASQRRGRKRKTYGTRVLPDRKARRKQ